MTTVLIEREARVQVTDAVVTIMQGRRARRFASPWLEGILPRVTRFERALAEQARALGAEVRGDTLCYAIPIESAVIVVCELEQLTLRLDVPDARVHAADL